MSAHAPEWFKEAPCAGQDRLFFSSHPSDRKEAVKICTTDCENTENCLKFALESELILGVWGGKTGPEISRELAKVNG
tara:strand:- start:17178 stop:17411 length:234 start_codon:yes stop_codon:yes gene_type:complete